MSTLYAIGVGVGDSEMLTLKAIDTLKKIDVLVLPEAKLGEGSVAYSIVQSHLKDNIEKLFLEFSMNKEISIRKKSRKEKISPKNTNGTWRRFIPMTKSGRTIIKK